MKKIIIYLEAVFWDFIDLRQKSWRKGFEGNDPGAGRLEEGRQEMNFLWSFFPRVRIDFCRLEEVRVETNDDSGWGGGIRKLHLEEGEGSFKAAVEMMIMVKMSIKKKHGQGDVGSCTITKKSDSVVFLCLLFVFFLVSPLQEKGLYLFLSGSPPVHKPPPLENGAMQTITTRALNSDYYQIYLG